MINERKFDFTLIALTKFMTYLCYYVIVMTKSRVFFDFEKAFDILVINCKGGMTQIKPNFGK